MVANKANIAGSRLGLAGGGVIIRAKRTQFPHFQAQHRDLKAKAKPIEANFPGPEGYRLARMRAS